ncbi:MAG: GTP-binding protein, partial [Planctomycetia bacterium]|nr:GTP-binding protein [Planctomycetia bacterium]
WGLWWVVGAALVSLSGWPLMRQLQQRTILPMPPDAGPAQDWSPAGRSAWADVEAIARRLDSEDVRLDRPEPLINLAREVVETVARQFHARSKNPVLEIPVPHVLQIVELVARDLRNAVSANIPGSHILTINDLVRIKKLVKLAPTLFRLYRLAALVVDPATALARELNAMAQERMLNASADETRRWVLQFAVRKTGFYAIELFSGHLVLRGVEFAGYSTGRSRQTIAGEQQRMTALQKEPLRILVLGQVKAGKSSLVNALFGQTRAAVDVVPRTKSVEPYLLERDGLPLAIILDTAGYEDPTQTAAALNQARDEIVKCDLVVLVSSAQNAARDADRRLLDEVRVLFQRTPDREFPPLIVALTRIDQLRPFREWDPPYDLTQPQGTKAGQIREAVETTAGDLAVEVERVIPVCLLEGKLYNVEESLIPAILSYLGAAQRLKYLRCLREFKDEEYWMRLRQQAANTGRFLMQTGWRLLENAVQPRQTPERDG